MKRHDQKQLGRKGFILFLLLNNSSSPKAVTAETQTGQKIETGADVEAIKGCRLLACSPWLTQPVSL